MPQATSAQLAAAGLANVPLAPDAKRVDLEVPSFSHPTKITNPLFPISELRSAVLAGHVEGKAFHTETTLLPVTRVIEWNDKRVETLVSQYTAFLGGRIEEVALDKYAQADDGSVWYFGEDVFDYRSGDIVSREGTWIAGAEHPPAMIMPAHPRVGDVYRSENAPGLVFEEVTVRKIGVTVTGPTGRVSGAMIGSELHSDGTREDKTFARGVAARDRAAAGTAAVEVARTILDLELRFRSPARVDRDRFVLWTRQAAVDASAADRGGVHGDVSALEWIRDRFALGLSPVDRTRADTELTELRALATDGSFGDIVRAAAGLRHAVERAALTT
jgi:hypothetical protein